MASADPPVIVDDSAPGEAGSPLILDDIHPFKVACLYVSVVKVKSGYFVSQNGSQTQFYQWFNLKYNETSRYFPNFLL